MLVTLRSTRAVQHNTAWRCCRFLPGWCSLQLNTSVGCVDLESAWMVCIGSRDQSQLLWLCESLLEGESVVCVALIESQLLVGVSKCVSGILWCESAVAAVAPVPSQIA
jgi:hypothetical protein